MLYLGTMGWSYSFWKIYPAEMKSKQYLNEYSKRFNSVEINNTFYRIPKRDTVKNWTEQVPQDFRFAIKFPQSITHSKDLLYDHEKLEVFLNRINDLGLKKGPLLLQFPPWLKQSNTSKLKDLINALPKDNIYAVEFRHNDWFTEKTFRLLKEHAITIVQVDHPKQPLIEEITGTFIYLRFEGNRKQVKGDKGFIEIDRTSSLEQWEKKIKSYLNQELDVYGYFSKYYSGYPPEDVIKLKKMIDTQNDW
jgi:uncharacterized protein YecE (DUF72 family)